MNEYVSTDNREGHLEWLTLDEALSNMSNTDRIILKNHDKKVTISEIRDMVNNHNITRVVFDGNTQHYATMVDGNISYASNDICYQLLNTESAVKRK